MSLGVLNNLSAVYAENNLNNSNTSLSKTLQQLSSGSRINSGADDAAGLSLVDGLQANQQALTQSQTNAQEGVGLLQVADGALTQVTNLLNRAVTLATEVSNGTLNTAQKQSANQEYQSILSEVNNIGATTTYNQNKVFGNSVSIVTGDSSANSASEDTLNIRGLSSSTVGDAGGSMVYSTGGGTFVNMSNTTANIATPGDVMNAGNISFQYWDNSLGSSQTDTLTISGGESVTSLISQINGAGLGVSAAFTTKAAALGTAGITGMETGIFISGNVNSTVPASAPGMAMEVAITSKDTSSTEASAGLTDSATGMAQISYNSGTDTTVNLSTTDLTQQANAEAALALLNTAVSDVASQDGYIGAQINTLNSVSDVLATQQQNVQSAQNAVQATDYAAASSNMSKYEILSQTGIAALAQANSAQQEVTKLLQ